MDPSDPSNDSSYEEVTEHIRKMVVSGPVEGIKFRQDRINWIMLFYGAFNPPHIGHLNFIRHSMANVGKDMSYACAFMIPKSVTFLRIKTPSATLELDEENRGRMIQLDRRLPSQVFAVQEQKAKGALTALKLLAQKHAIRVRYTLLRGVETDLPLSWNELATESLVDNVLVNTFGRQGERHLESWKIKSEDWHALHDAEEDVKRYQSPLGDRKSVIRGYVRVILPKDKEKSEISSSGIRTVASGCSPDQLQNCQALSQVALSWNLLCLDDEWLRWIRWRRETHEWVVRDCRRLEKVEPPDPGIEGLRVQQSWAQEIASQRFKETNQSMST